MRKPHPLATCALACLASLPAAFSASGQSALEQPQQNRAEEQRLEAEKRQLEAQQRQLEQQRNRLETEMRRAKEAAERAKEQAEQAARRAKEQAEQVARRARDEAQRQYQSLFRQEHIPGSGRAEGGPLTLARPPQGENPSDFERELFRAQGLDGGPPASGEMAAFLGVSTAPAPASIRKRVELPDGIGLVVSSVERGSPAEQAGLKQYDILHKLNDQLLVNMEQLAVLVRTFKPGEEVRLSVIRGGKPQELRAKLGERRQPPPTPQGGPFAPGLGGDGFMPMPGQPGQPAQPPRTTQPPQPNPQFRSPQRFWMPNPLRRGPAAVAPAAPAPGEREYRAVPPPPSPDPAAVPLPQIAPLPEAAPAVVPAPAPATPAAPPQLHVVPLPAIPAAPAAPVPVPEPAAVQP